MKCSSQSVDVFSRNILIRRKRQAFRSSWLFKSKTSTLFPENNHYRSLWFDSSFNISDIMSSGGSSRNGNIIIPWSFPWYSWTTKYLWTCKEYFFFRYNGKQAWIQKILSMNITSIIQYFTKPCLNYSWSFGFTLQLCNEV